MQDIKDFNLLELTTRISSQGFPSFCSRQIFSWIYKKGVFDFEGMTDLPLALRRYLKQNFYIIGLAIAKKLKSSDNTEKFLLRIMDGNCLEAVLIPTQKRVTACISSQVGCKFSCRFCASGVSGFKRNLGCGEIIEQLLLLKNFSSAKRITHLVLMGTGEPLDNYDNVLKAIRIINSKEGLNLASRRITISTCGLIPQIKRLSSEGLQIELSVSLHAAEDALRSSLMPVNKKYPLEELIDTCKDYALKTNRQVTFEYILIKDINSSLKDAQNLVKILSDFKLFKVNLIPANNIPELKVIPPLRKEIYAFKNYLLSNKIKVTLRKERGKDIKAACGQLRIKYETDPNP